MTRTARAACLGSCLDAEAPMNSISMYKNWTNLLQVSLELCYSIGPVWSCAIVLIVSRHCVCLLCYTVLVR